MAKNRIVSDDVFKMAQDFKNYVEANHQVPYKLTYHNVDYFTKDMTYIFVYALYHLKSNFDIPVGIKWCKKAQGDDISENIKTDDYKQQAKDVYNYIIKNGQVPDNVTTKVSKKKVNIDLFTYCMAKVLASYKANNQLPDFVGYNSKVFDESYLLRTQIASIAKKVKEYVAKNYEIPSQIDNVRHGDYTYIFAKTIVKPDDYKKKGVGMAPKPEGTYISRTIDKKDYIQLAKNLIAYVDKNGRLPNYLSWNGYNIKSYVYQDAFARIVDYYYTHDKTLPAYVNMNSNAFVKPEPEKKTSGDEVFNHFVSKFGNVSTFDDALEKIQGRIYGYYYDDVYPNITAVNRMYSKSGVNCTDACQVFWHIAKALGYEVQCLHVKCAGGDGHVRLKLRHPVNSGNEWFYRDPAAVLDGEAIEYNWCTSGYRLLATNPSWFLANVNR